MIELNIPLKREEVKKLMAEDFPELKFESEKGMKFYYSSDNDEAYAPLIKAAIKAQEYGQTLYFGIQIK